MDNYFFFFLFFWWEGGEILKFVQYLRLQEYENDS